MQLRKLRLTFAALFAGVAIVALALTGASFAVPGGSPADEQYGGGGGGGADVDVDVSSDSSSSSKSSSKSNSNANSSSNVNVDVTVVICKTAGGGYTTIDPKKAPHAHLGAGCKITIDKRAPIVKVPKKKLRAKHNRTIPLRLSCPAHETNGCQGIAKLRTTTPIPNRLLTATTGKRLNVGQKKFTIKGGTTKTLKLRLTNKSYRILKKTKKLRVWIKINAQDAAGNKKTTGHPLTLLPPRP